MVIGRQHAIRCWSASAVAVGMLWPWLAVRAADVGGFYADQQKAHAVAAEKDAAGGCAQTIARAPGDGSALAAYRAALCYLHAEQPDVLAAKAWLSRATDLGFMPAQRLLRSVLIAEAGPHGPAPHCHALGDGQQMCHGGGPPLAPAPTR